ncbi:hypothetical protein RYX36_014700 [Vicia faba]
MVLAKKSISCISKSYKSSSRYGYAVKHHRPQSMESVVDDKSGNHTNGIRDMGLNAAALREKYIMMSSRLGCYLCRHRSLGNSRIPSNLMASTSRNNSINRKRNKLTRSKSVESFDDFVPAPSSLNTSGSFQMPPRMPSRSGSIRKNGAPIMYF